MAVRSDIDSDNIGTAGVISSIFTTAIASAHDLATLISHYGDLVHPSTSSSVHRTDVLALLHDEALVFPPAVISHMVVAGSVLVDDLHAVCKSTFVHSDFCNLGKLKVVIFGLDCIDILPMVVTTVSSVDRLRFQIFLPFFGDYRTVTS